MVDKVEYELTIDDRGAISTAKRFGDAVKAMSDPGPVDKQAQAFVNLMNRLEPLRAAAQKLASEQKLLDNAYLNGQLTLDRYTNAGQKLRAEQAAGTQVQAQQTQGLAAMAGGFIAAQLTVGALTNTFRTLTGIIREGIEEAAGEERQLRAMSTTIGNIGMSAAATMPQINDYATAMQGIGIADDVSRQAALRMLVVTKDVGLALEAANIAQSVSYAGLMGAQEAQSMMAGLLLGRTRELRAAGKELGITVDENASEAQQAAEAYRILSERFNFTAAQMTDTKSTIDAGKVAWGEFKEGVGAEFIRAFGAASAVVVQLGVDTNRLGRDAAAAIPILGAITSTMDGIAKIQASPLGMVRQALNDAATATSSYSNATDKTIGSVAAASGAYQTEAQRIARLNELSEQGAKYLKEQAEAQKAGAAAATQAAAAQAQLLATYNPMHAQAVKLTADEAALNAIVRKGGEDAYWASAALESLYEARRKLFTIADEAAPIIPITRPDIEATYTPPQGTAAPDITMPMDLQAQATAHAELLAQQSAFLSQMGADLAAGLASMLSSWEQYDAQVLAGNMTAAQATTMKWAQAFAFVGQIFGTMASAMNVQSKADFERQKNLQKAQAVMNAASAVMAIWATVMTLGPIAGPIVGGVLTALVAAQLAMQMSKINSQQYTPPAAKGFETGTPYVPRTGLYQLHEGERVVPRSVAAAKWGSSDTAGLSQPINVTIDARGAWFPDQDSVNMLAVRIREAGDRGYV